MKNQFAWYFKPDDAETKKIWEQGLLTLDANVLLDLYRYHENTRNAILQSLKSFNGRLWLSHQTAEEFFRNRAKVIVGSSNGFKQATDEIAKLRNNIVTSTDQLQSNRIIAAEVIENLRKSLLAAVDEAKTNIDTARDEFPNYLDKDPVLEELLQKFDGSVGKPFDEEELKVSKAEAERRKKNQIPPGYMDSDKDGDRPSGDYYMWRQILAHTKAKAQAMILVTSERKEDWWERPSGKTIGPRQELLKEAHELTGQRILIYQTDRFLQFAAEYAGRKVDESAVAEIRAVDTLRIGNTNAVKVISQDIGQSSQLQNSGRLIVELKKPLYKFTASGHFEPSMIDVPYLRAELADSPSALPKYRISSGTGTNHDFNIHLKSQDFGAVLPAGIYVFEYTARCSVDNPNDTINTVEIQAT